MENQKVIIEKTSPVRGLNVVTVVRIATYARRLRGSFAFFGLKEPLYILVKTAGAPLKAFNSEGLETTPEQIISEYPHLRQDLEI